MKTQTTHTVTTLRPTEVGTSVRSLGSQNRDTRLRDAMNTHAATQQVRNVATLATKFRNAVLLGTLMVALASVASADLVHDLTISLFNPECIQSLCEMASGLGGGPAQGAADFTDLGYPYWSFSFDTGAASWWEDIDGTYLAGFNSGSIGITGPYGLTFNGTVTQGSVEYSLAYESAEVAFSGTWSNGLYGSGSAEVFISASEGASSNFDITTAPEPASLALFGSGVLGLAGVLRRRLMG